MLCVTAWMSDRSHHSPVRLPSRSEVLLRRCPPVVGNAKDQWSRSRSSDLRTTTARAAATCRQPVCAPWSPGALAGRLEQSRNPLSSRLHRRGRKTHSGPEAEASETPPRRSLGLRARFPAAEGIPASAGGQAGSRERAEVQTKTGSPCQGLPAPTTRTRRRTADYILTPTTASPSATLISLTPPAVRLRTGMSSTAVRIAIPWAV